MSLRIDDLTNATSCVGTDEMEFSLAGAAGSRKMSMANLRKQLFAGGSGFTSTDPITAGAASFTTGAFSGAVSFAGAVGDNIQGNGAGTVTIQTGGSNRLVLISTTSTLSSAFTATGLITGSAGVTVASGQTLTLTGATVAGQPTWSSIQSMPGLTLTSTLTATVGNFSSTLSATGDVKATASAAASRLVSEQTGTGTCEWILTRTAGTTSTWEGYIPGGSSDFRLFGAAADRFIFTTAGVFTSSAGIVAGTGGATVTKWLTATLTYDPPATDAGSAYTTTVTVTGAVAGDLVLVQDDYLIDHTNYNLHGYVSAADTVTVVLQDLRNSGISNNFSGSRTVRVWVVKF